MGRQCPRVGAPPAQADLRCVNRHGHRDSALSTGDHARPHTRPVVNPPVPTPGEHPSGGEPLDARPGWQSDPTGHYEFRWWDGSAWTNRVAGEGVPAHEGRFAALPPAQRVWGGADIAAYADPERYVHAFGRVTMPTTSLRRWEVAGEGGHQQDLDVIAGPKQYGGVWVESVATLVPEPEVGRPDAVNVEIEGMVVGRLDDTEGTAHRRLVDRATRVEGRATCGAVINGGWYRQDEESEGSYGVHLYFGYGPGAGPADLPDPAEGEERIPYRIRDHHDHITVTGEQHTQDALESVLGDDWVGDHPFRLAHLTVDRDTDAQGRPIVRVDIAGSTVGSLTVKMSERFAPATETAVANGCHLTAAATLEQSSRKNHEHEIDVVLRVPRGWGR
jgi:hypothetical protein